MSYKIGLILSMIFVALFFLFGADLITLESVYSGLDAKANNISYIISRRGVIDDELIDYVQSTFNVTFNCEQNLAPTFGEQIFYQVSTTYRPMVLSKNEMIITIERMTIVGFYG